jgi:hypothetical protein
MTLTTSGLLILAMYHGGLGKHSSELTPDEAAVLAQVGRVHDTTYSRKGADQVLVNSSSCQDPLHDSGQTLRPNCPSSSSITEYSPRGGLGTGHTC